QIPAYDAKQHVTLGELVEVLPQATAVPLPMSAVYPERRYASRRVTVFVDWVQELYGRFMEA
ncbi:MAG: LysR family transcriptional regulator, partial [Burkholderiales bacterium]